MADRLKGKTAFVTAAGQGIGRAIAETFIAEGATVIATDLDAGKLKDLKAAKCQALDALSTKDVEAAAKSAIDAFGAPDILANCAGFVHQGTVLECSEQDWDFSFDINVKSMHRTLRAFLPAMLAHGGGSIVNISSAVSSIRGVPARYVYGATKAAIIGLTKAVAADYIRQGIRVNAICPGTIQSPSLNERIEANAKKTGQSLDAARTAFIERQPIGRLGTVQEVANLALFLASDEFELHHRAYPPGRRRHGLVRFQGAASAPARSPAHGSWAWSGTPARRSACRCRAGSRSRPPARHPADSRPLNRPHPFRAVHGAIARRFRLQKVHHPD